MSEDYEDERSAARRRSSAARIGANAMWARTDDWSARTAPARRAFMARFEQQVDPEGVLDPHIRAKKADAAMREYMGRLAKGRKKNGGKRRPAAKKSG